ncbi:MAG: aminotransferase class I/II-fold pyridoxal phosphate-dependent enzyme [Bacteroidales bacterium]|nr:aminotransferase class I/II-fold pyridoxal phosphate-dependent enzyme [Bacteroidales bacterium]
MPDFKNFETNAIRNRIEETQHNEHSVPIFATSGYLFEDAEYARAIFADECEGNIYGRYTNPNSDELISKLAHMEGTEDGIAAASGMSAVFLSFISFLRAGDHIVASRSLFGTTHTVLEKVLPRFGITHTYVDATAELDEWQEEIMPQTRMIYLETPSNPGLDLNDMEQFREMADENNCLLVVDNTFATPYIQTPIKHGAHLVCHSTTKFLDGQGRTLGGAILGAKEYIEEVRMVARATGPIMSPFNAWIISKSLETLAVRMERHCESALKLAEHLASHNEIESVKYPFLPSHPQYELAKKQMRLGGGLVSFEPKGGKERAVKFVDSLKMFSISANLGDSRTIITHPSTTTHSKMTEDDRQSVGITQSLLRLSVGLEHIDDIIGDIEQALKASK